MGNGRIADHRRVPRMDRGQLAGETSCRGAREDETGPGRRGRGTDDRDAARREELGEAAGRDERARRGERSGRGERAGREGPAAALRVIAFWAVAATPVRRSGRWPCPRRCRPAPVTGGAWAPPP